MDPALQELLRSGAHDEALSAIVRLDPREPLPAHVRVVARFGDIATVRVRRGDVAEAYASDGIASFKASRLLLPEPLVRDDEAEAGDGEAADETADEAAIVRMRASDLRRRPDWPTGRGVLVAALDWGLDFTHPEFRHADGRTRLVAVWDQSARYSRQFPNAYRYGRIYGRNEIDRALAAADPFAALGYDPRRADRGGGTHGTHVMGIAAGNGRAGGPAGMAPQAGLLFVHLATSGGRSGATPLTDSAAVLEALHFVDAQAAARPVCINMSLGTHGGPHDGSSLVEQGIDAFVATSPRRIVVQSAGNYFARRVHAAGRLAAGGRASLPVLIDSEDTTANDIEAWYRGCDELRVQVRAPDGRVLATAALGETVLVRDGDVEIGRLYHRRSDPNNRDHQVQLHLDAPAATGRWTLELEAVRISDGRYDSWIERDSRCAPCQPLFPAERAATQSTTGSICNGRGSIVVGAYDTRQPTFPLARFSSSGPTRDGRGKPDLIAPGVRVLSARSTPRAAPASAAAEPALLTRMSGTSMAAPHVTGAAALLCAAAGRALSCQRVRTLLCASAAAYPPASLSDADRLRSGAGRLDIAAALHAAHALARPRAASSTAVPSPSTARPTPEIVMESTANPGACACNMPPSAPAEHSNEPAATDVAEAAELIEALTAEMSGADESDAGDEVEYVVRRRRRGPATRISGPIIAPVIGIGGGGVGAAVVAPLGGGIGLALPLGGTPPAAQSPAAAPACACATPAAVAVASSDPVVVASDEPSVAAADSGEANGVWQVSARDAEQAAASLAAEHLHESEAHESEARASDTPAHAPMAWPAPVHAGGSGVAAGHGDAWDDADAGIEHVDDYDELAENAVGDNPLQDAAQFVVDLLARAGFADSDEAFDEHAFAAPAMPARLFDHFSGRRHALPDALARRFDAIALPGQPLPPLAAGDWLLRRGDAGFGHVAVLASPRVWPPQALRRDGFTLEHDRPGGFVHVIEPGHRASLREDRFARRLCDAGQRVLPDTLVLRPQTGQPRPRVRMEGEHDDGERDDESVDGRWIQDALNRILGINLTVDGQIGPQSRAAIRAFQEQRRLTVDGVVGARTEAALRDALSAGGGTALGVRPGSGGSPTAPMSPPGTTNPCTTLDAFDQGRETLQPAHHTLLIGIARRIQRDGIRVVIVTGFASSEGDDVSNLTLGQRRADSVARALRDTLERMRPGSSRGVAMPTFSRGESDQIASADPARNRRVTVCLQVRAPVPPRPVPPPQPQPPVTPLQTKLFTVTGKSFIAPVGSNRGSLNCGINIGPLTIPGASNSGLFALALATDAAYSEDPASDRISTAPPPDNKGYRLFSQGQVQAAHRGTDLISVSLGAGLRIDAGRECVPSISISCLSPGIVIDQPFATRRINASSIHFRWAVKGRPHPVAEPSFQAICLRDSVFIWHTIKGVVDVSSGVPRITSLIIEGSRFPSHRAWVDNVETHRVRQGPMSNLWDGTSGDPTRVR